MIAEAGNFPRLARFYSTPSSSPGRTLMRTVLERGIKSGEFRAVAIDNFVHLIIAPLLLRQCMQHSFMKVVPGMQFGDEQFFDVFVEHLLHSLAPVASRES